MIQLSSRLRAQRVFVATQPALRRGSRYATAMVYG